jgi:hypothetical protein
MPASVCVLDTVQGGVDTVPYHTQRLLKSADIAGIFSARAFPDRRDQLSVRVIPLAPFLAQRGEARRVARGPTKATSTSLAQRFAAMVSGIEDHENDLVGCV